MPGVDPKTALELHRNWLRYGVTVDRDPPDLSGVDFTTLGPLINENLSNAKLCRAIFNSLDLSHIDLSSADCRGAQFREATLLNANLTGAKFGPLMENEEEGTKFTTTFDRANMANAHVTGADFTDASLQNANLSGIKGRQVIFNGCNLFDTRMDRVELQQPLFVGARLDGNSFKGATILRARGLRFSNSFTIGLVLEPHSRDHWSRLKRSFSGPRLIAHILLLVAFLFLTVGRSTLHSGLIYQETLHGMANQPISNGTPPSISRYCVLYPEKCKQVTLFSALTGWHALSALETSALLVSLAVHSVRMVLIFVFAPMQYMVNNSGYIPPYDPTRLVDRTSGNLTDRIRFRLGELKRGHISYGLLFRVSAYLFWASLASIALMATTIYLDTIPALLRMVHVPTVPVHP